MIFWSYRIWHRKHWIQIDVEKLNKNFDDVIIANLTFCTISFRNKEDQSSFIVMIIFFFWNVICDVICRTHPLSDYTDDVTWRTYYPLKLRIRVTTEPDFLLRSATTTDPSRTRRRTTGATRSGGCGAAGRPCVTCSCRRSTLQGATSYRWPQPRPPRPPPLPRPCSLTEAGSATGMLFLKESCRGWESRSGFCRPTGWRRAAQWRPTKQSGVMEAGEEVFQILMVDLGIGFGSTLLMRTGISLEAAQWLVDLTNREHLKEFYSGYITE